MKMLNIQLDKEKLLMIPELERTLFFALGHSANEINAIAKMLYWASKPQIANIAEEHGQLTIQLLYIRFLAGVLNESWELIRTKYFGSALSRKYEPKLDDRALNALRFLKTYFDKNKSACSLIRDNFAFHYSPNEVAAIFPDIDEKLHLYIDRQDIPNNLFFFSETLLSKALLSLLENAGKPTTFEDLVGELFKVSANFVQLADAIMFAIIDTFGEDLRAGKPQEIQFKDIQEFQNVVIPWFTDNSNLFEVMNSPM